MIEESTTPNLVERARESMEAANRLDFDAAVMRVFAPDAVFDVSSAGLGTFEGAVAIRGYLEDWIGAFEHQAYTGWDGYDLGRGVVFIVADFDAQPVGSTGTVHERWSFTVLWTEGTIARVIARTDIDEARAAAERLAEERAYAMSENLDLVRSIYAAWERGDMSGRGWADPEIECVIADGPTPGRWHGPSAMRDAWRDFLSVWEDWRIAADEYRELDGARVLVLESRSARAKGSGLRIGETSGETRSKGASLFDIRDGTVTRFVTYFNRNRALAELGIEE